MSKHEGKTPVTQKGRCNMFFAAAFLRLSGLDGLIYPQKHRRLLPLPRRRLKDTGFYGILKPLP